MPDERSREELLIRLRTLEDEARIIRERLAHDDAETQRELVVLGVGTAQRFVLDVHEVLEVTPWARCLPIPGAPAYVLGLLDVRGALVPVVDTAARLFGACARPALGDSIVLASVIDGVSGPSVSGPRGSGPRVFGLRVVGIPEVRRVHGARLEAVSAEVDVSRFVAGVFRSEGEPLSKLDLRALLAPEGLVAEPP